VLKNKKRSGMLMAKIISTDADLQNCIYFQWVVEVWIQGELDDSTKVIAYSDIAVDVIKGSYLRYNITIKKHV
jgi:hypothetical protein